jgi:putative DNA primase/helicase
MTGVARLPYRLPKLLKADTIFVVEGEKDADKLAEKGLTATTNPGGAGKWRREYGPYFQGKAVAILPDNDKPGKDHAFDVARKLCSLAGSVKVVELPGLPEKGDVSDWIKAGGSVEQLQALVEAAQEFDPGQPSQAVKEDKAKPTQAELLIKLAGDVELFHDLNRSDCWKSYFGKRSSCLIGRVF